MMDRIYHLGISLADDRCNVISGQADAYCLASSEHEARRTVLTHWKAPPGKHIDRLFVLWNMTPEDYDRDPLIAGYLRRDGALLYAQ